MSRDGGPTIRARVRSALAPVERAVLAVSGGLDSMALLDAAAAVVPRDRLLVATFDHATGSASRRAVALVRRRSRELGIEVVAGLRRSTDREAGVGAGPRRSTEAAWRADRWRFLAEAAASRGDIGAGTIVTAHTRDDQIETVLMRIMRGAGARGIAGLYAPSEILRPLLDLSRDQLARYARRRRLVWVDDPTNRSRAYLRNRIRLDLLPAIRRADASFDAWILHIGHAAARWRRDVDVFVERNVPYAVPYAVPRAGTALDVAISGLVGYSRESLAVLWPALAGRVGVALDWRGTRRLVEFTIHCRVGSCIQLSGGWQVVRGRHHLEMRRERDQPPGEMRLDGPTIWGQWRFDVVGDAQAVSAWSASLPVDAPLRIRRWQAGDTMMAGCGGGVEAGLGRVERKVKRFLSDAGVHGPARTGWPVVLAGDEIVWIPGIRRTEAAADRCGKPELVYACEFSDG